MGDVGELARIAAQVSAAIHELQKERGSTSIYVDSKGAQFAVELRDQRAAADQPLARLRVSLGQSWLGEHGRQLGVDALEAKERLERLTVMRARIDRLDVDGAAATGYYTETIDELLDVVADMAGVTTESSVAAHINAFENFIHAKEMAGQERALGAAAFAAGKMTGDQWRRYREAAAVEGTYLEVFASVAPPDLRTFERATVTGPAVDEVARLRRLASETFLAGQPSGIDPAQWFKAATARIDLFKKVEDTIAARLLEHAAGLERQAEKALYAWVALTVVLLAATIAAATTCVVSITGPVARLTAVMRGLAAGDNSVEVPDATRRDELGQIARAVQVFKENAIEMSRLRAEQEAIKQRAEQDRRATMARLADQFEGDVQQVVSGVSTAVGQMQATAQTMSATAEQTSQQAGNVAAASEQAAANVQTVAAAAEELSACIGGIARQVSESAQIASNAVEQAERADTVVQGLLTAAQRIGEVVSLINNIAAQTNLLALNATIEAARAGDAGKGFAVVANEVKTLAGQTARATSEISQQVAAIQTVTHEAVGAIQNIAGTIARINEISTSVASSVEQQNAATLEISRNVQEAAHGTAEVTANIVGVTQAASATGESSQEVLTASKLLARQADDLRKQVGSFLATVRAA